MENRIPATAPSNNNTNTLTGSRNYSTATASNVRFYLNFNFAQNFKNEGDDYDDDSSSKNVRKRDQVKPKEQKTRE